MNEQIRLEVQRRAADRCEYCGILSLLDLLPFQVDHIIAVKHGGRTELSNLAWSCFDCNVFKGPNVAGVDPADGTLAALFNPRNDRRQMHFR